MARPRLAQAALAATLGVGGVALLACVSDPGLLLGPGNGVGDWVQNAVSGSGVEQALFRLMTLPGGDILFRRSPRESRPELSSLLQANPGKAALYSLRAMEDERALDFNAAEQDWKSWAQKADDKAGASLDLASYYERRLKPQEELAALAVAGASDPPPAERLKSPGEQRPWKAWEQSLSVIERFALPRTAAVQIYSAWERRYPQVREVYQKELDFALAGKDFPAAAAVIERYRKALPADRVFPVTAQAALESARDGEAAGAAVYARAFEPLWPASLVESYMTLLTANHGARKAADGLRSRLQAHPEGGGEALKDVARLYYLDQKLGQLDAAKLALSDYRQRKEARGAPWSAEELFTLGQLYEQAQDFPDAARYYYALAAQKASGDEEERGLAGMARILLTAPEQPLRIGAGNLALYKNIATIDRGPGYWNGILSLWMNSQDAAGEFSTQDELATPYFHRAKAAQIVAEIDRRFAQSADRPELHQRLMSAYAAYGEDAATIREGTAFLEQFPGNERRVAVALAVADVYSSTNQTDKEIALYRDQLKELAARNQGLPLNSVDYQHVLDRALARLVQLKRLPDALLLLRGELDRNPGDPGLYDKLAQFLEQNRLNAQQEEVYQKAIAQFQQSGVVDGWYGKLARFYLRQRRGEDYRSLTRKVTGIFSGTELERYLKDAPAPDASLAYEVESYAHDRFPHDLSFVHALLNYRRTHHQDAELEKLLWEHWWEDPALRDELFARLSADGRLDAQLELLKKQSPEVDHADWSGLARRNPAAGLFWVESCLWRSHFEDGVAAAEALSAEYPDNGRMGEIASSLERSLAYFHPEATDKAVAIEARLLQSDPGNLDRMARIGDIYADRGRMSEAAPYWLRMAEAHPGQAEGYLQSATVFWDYFDFSTAMTQLQKGREKLAQPALFSYETGAIQESLGDLRGAIRDYAAGALAETPSAESRARFLALARRPEMQPLVEAQTEGLLRAAAPMQAAPTQAAIDLRVAVLDASHRRDQVDRELREAVAVADSFAVLDALANAARGHGLREVEEAALRRQISLTADPVHKLELRYQLVDLIGRRDAAAAAAEVDAVYRENPKILGVVRSTVDYDWNHERRPQAVTVLLDAAQSAYPDLRDKLQLEASRKLTDLGDFSRARKLLEELLSRNPLDAAVETALAANYARAGDNAGLAAFYQARLAAVKSADMERGEKLNRLALLRRGMIPAAEQLGQWDVATDQYIELINSYPGDATLVEEAAQTAGAHGQRERLAGFYRQTIEKSPRDARWSIVLAEIETALEDFPAAIDAYGKAIRIRPEQKDLYIARAGLCERLHRLDDAVADYDKLYSLSYHDPAWKLKIAEARARQGRSADAVKALEEAWILGHPAKAADHFRVAAQLEQWNLLDEARGYAERGADLAGAAWLVDGEARTGVAVYARIMARLRRNDEAFNRLAAARMQAEQLPVDVSLGGTPFDASSGVTLDEWRNRLRTDRGVSARQAFAEGLLAMGKVVSLYATPEEKAQFAGWLQSKSSTASDGAELRNVYLPAIQAAGLKAMEADLLWQFVAKSSDPAKSELRDWLQLQRSRVQIDDAGKRIEELAAQAQPKQRAAVLHQAAAVYKTLNNTEAELRVLTALDRLHGAGSGFDDRFFDLLLAARPNDLVARSGKDAVAQRMLERAKPELALAAIDARAANLPPVWKPAYTGLAGLYLRVHQPAIRQGFEEALAPDLSIGERIDHPADRKRQLAGEIWFYYGSRYGEYLDEEKDPRAEGLLEAELEHTPTRASAYSDLAAYLESAGRTETALADYRRSLALNHDQPVVQNAIAVLESNAGRRAEAVTAWKQAVRLLAEEMDARKVPESFWESFCAVLEDASKHNAYGELSADVDNMLRIYLRRNGSYRADPLLESGYLANHQSLNWLIDMANQVRSEDDNGFFLRQVAQSNWVAAEERTELQSRVIDQLRARQKPGERDYELESMERNLIQALLDARQYARARDELARFAAGQSALDTVGDDLAWVNIQLQLADVGKTLPELLARWKKNPAHAPASGALETASLKLSEAGRRVLLRYVYESALEKRQFTAANFIGLAGVDLDEGKKEAALDLLKRLTLAGSDMFADTDAAAALLEKKKLFGEALPFLHTLADAFPWKADYQVRLAVAELAAHPQNGAPLAALTAVAADPRALYTDRQAAAEALRGRAKGSAGSLELDLLTHTGCIGADEASHPYFVAARLAAAACAPAPARSEELLRGALADAPGNALVRLRYVQAAFAAAEPHLALLAAESIDINGLLSGIPAFPGYDEQGRVLPAQPALDPSLLKPEERSKLLWSMLRAREKRDESNTALALIVQFLPMEKDAARKAALEKERDRLQLDIARQTENGARAPIVHRALEQDRMVRPRLLEGMAFTPRKPHLFEEAAE